MDSDFLIVAGEEWQEVPNATELINNGIGVNNLQQMIDGQEWGNISPMLEDAGLIPANATISNAKFVNTGDANEPLKMWFIL